MQHLTPQQHAPLPLSPPCLLLTLAFKHCVLWHAPVGYIAGSLKSALQKQIDAAAASTDTELKEGMKCIRNNCAIVYEGEDSLTKTCTHCPGEPVFHEGYKYVSVAIPQPSNTMLRSVATVAFSDRTAFREGLKKSRQIKCTPVQTARAPTPFLETASPSFIFGLLMCTLPVVVAVLRGVRYWSCCEGKKTLDFDSFLSMTGCADEQKCKWFKDAAEEGEVEEKQCRHDWYETPGDVVVEIFAKCAIPEKTVISINADTLDITTVYEKTNKFSLRVDLAGKIDVTIAKVTLFSTKINIKLKKSEGGKWGSLAVGDAPAEE